MSIGNDEIEDAPETIKDVDLSDVVGGRPGGKPTTTTGRWEKDAIFGVQDGVNNDTLFAGPGDDDDFIIGGPAKFKR